MNINNIHPLDLALKAAISGNADYSERILRSLEQDDLRVMFNLGWHEIRHGNLSKGLSLMDAGRFIGCFGNSCIRGTIWKNQPLKDKVILFRCEGGFGDQIINFRFAKDFVNLGAKVVISCSPELLSLFSKQGYICIDNEAAEAVYYDYWVPAMSAAHMLGYEYNTLSGNPYLSAKARNLRSTAGNLKVGIRWAGNPRFEHEQHRKFNPAQLISLHEVDGVDLYSLQRDDDLIENLPFADLRDDLKTWDDTAEILNSLDLVITSCTSIAHCAAALGVFTWVIVPVLPYYTWARPGNTSAWYSSVRLFRQEVYGDWNKPLQDIKTELCEFTRNSICGTSMLKTE